jgi:hypothetical protein
MALSSEARAQLQARAAGLRQEVSAVRSEADLALQEKAQERADDKLVVEVLNLEAAAERARLVRDQAKGGTVEDALAVMNSVAGVPAPGTPGETSPVAPVPVVEPTIVATGSPAVLSDPFADGGAN